MDRSGQTTRGADVIELHMRRTTQTMKRFPLILAGVVLLTKLAVVLLARTSADHVPMLFNQIVQYDVPSFWAAEAMTRLFSDQTRFFPRDPEAMVFDGALLLFTWLEWYSWGILIVWLLARRRPNSDTGRRT